MVNYGKKFEEIIKRDFSKVSNAAITRLYDPIGGYINIRNVCDFIGYIFPYCFYLEAKSVKGNTFNLNNLTQYEALLNYKNIEGLHPGVLVWFYEHNKIVWCSIKTLEYLKSNGIKSININQPASYDFVLETITNRIYPIINFNQFYSKIKEVV